MPENNTFNTEGNSNNTIDIKGSFSAQLSNKEFDRLSIYINRGYGIKLPYAKKTMLQCRLQKRLRDLNLTSFGEYCDYVFSDAGKEKEIIHMVDVVTTNKTDFFREPSHFQYLEEKVLPDFIEENSGNRNYRVWSAGCSSGEEPYTLAMVLQEFFNQYSGYDYSILGTDISSRILEKALNAIYTMERVANIPIELKRKYFLKSKDPAKPLVRVQKFLRAKTSYQRLNFMDDFYDIKGGFDAIFCRNVLIYFEKDIQEKVINRLCTKLKFGGHFFLGHSESIMGMNVPLKQLRPTVFQKI